MKEGRLLWDAFLVLQKAASSVEERQSQSRFAPSCQVRSLPAHSGRNTQTAPWRGMFPLPTQGRLEEARSAVSPSHAKALVVS